MKKMRALYELASTANDQNSHDILSGIWRYSPFVFFWSRWLNQSRSFHRAPIWSNLRPDLRIQKEKKHPMYERPRDLIQQEADAPSDASRHLQQYSFFSVLCSWLDIRIGEKRER